MKNAPEGKWHCPRCTEDKGFVYSRRARTKRVMKKTVPEKLTIPDNTKSNKKEKAPSIHDGSPDVPKPSSSRRPILVRLKRGSNTLKLGSSDKSEEKKTVKSESIDSAMRKKSKEDDDKGSDKKSTGNDKRGSDKKKSSRLKKSKLVYNSDGSNEEASSTSDYSGSRPRKRQDDQRESSRSFKKEKKKTGYSSKKKQEVAIYMFIYYFYVLFDASFDLLEIEILGTLF